VNVAQTQSHSRSTPAGKRQTIQLPEVATEKRMFEDFLEPIDNQAGIRQTHAESLPFEPTVLVVDDDTRLLDLVQELLMSVGYRVIRATNGRTAFEIARRMHPDLILSDRHMPEGGGDELVQRLRSAASTRSIPIVLMSSCDPERALPAGVRFLPKPFDLDYLLRTVNDHVHATHGIQG